MLGVETTVISTLARLLWFNDFIITGDFFKMLNNEIKYLTDNDFVKFWEAHSTTNNRSKLWTGIAAHVCDVVILSSMVTIVESGMTFLNLRSMSVSNKPSMKLKMVDGGNGMNTCKGGLWAIHFSNDDTFDTGRYFISEFDSEITVIKCITAVRDNAFMFSADDTVPSKDIVVDFEMQLSIIPGDNENKPSKNCI